MPTTVTIHLPEHDVELQCDAVKIQSVFGNLIGNAIYAMDNRGQIIIKINESITDVKISIIDSGSGIPNYILPHIFEPLFTSKPIGAGLGIYKNIVEQHHGKIYVTNDPTTFTVELPKS